MLKTKLLAALLLTGVFSTDAYALNISDLDGRWTVAWPNNTKNTLRLTYSGGGYSGIYVSDDGALCPTTASFKSATGAVSFHVVCPTWNVHMNGTVAANGASVSGSYVAHGSSKGSFSMTRQAAPAPAVVQENRCSDAPQPDGSLWRTCVGDDAQRYCELCKSGQCSRVGCN